MKFQFNVNLSEQDYVECNIFSLVKSHHGKNQIRTFRVTLAVLFAVLMVISLFGGFSTETFISVIPMIILFVVWEIFLPKFISWTVKSYIKALKKSGKMAYPPESVIEFYEDSFVEITPEHKTELQYCAVERISIVDNKVMYIHINNISLYILPLSCFENKEQYDSFFSFIKTKCSNIDIY